MGILLPIIIAVLVLLMLLIVFISEYQTTKSDEALIISGSYLDSENVHVDEGDNKIKIVRGGDAFVLPVFQRPNRISLFLNKLDVSTPEVYTEQGVPVMYDGTPVIKTGSPIEETAIAARQFLGKATEKLENEVRGVLEGHSRSILGSMTVEKIYQNRDKFSQSVQEVASVDLTRVGLVIVSLTVKEVRGKNGYLDSLEKPRIAQVKRDAGTAETEALKEARIKKVETEKESRQVKLQRQTGTVEASKEKRLKLALYKQGQDIAKAKVDQAYNLGNACVQQHVVKQKMKVKVAERQKRIESGEKEITRREKQCDSEAKKKADADCYVREQEAPVQRAHEVTEAETECFEVEALAEAEANKTRLTGQAQAEAILAHDVAKAEAKRKIVDVFKEHGKAAVLSMVTEMLPQLMKEATRPLGDIDKTSVIDMGAGGENSSANRTTNCATDLLVGTQKTLRETTGLDVKEPIENFSKKGTLNSVNYHATEGSEKEQKSVFEEQRIVFRCSLMLH